MPVHLGFAALASFDIGPNRLTVLALGLPLPLVVALLAARSYRFAWAGRATLLAVGGLAAAWLVDRGSLPAQPDHDPGVPHALRHRSSPSVRRASSPASQQDVRGTTFSWRQPLGVVALVGAARRAVPLLPAMASGRWELKDDRRSSLLALLPATPPGASSRVLWVGPPEEVPVPGWPLHDGLIFALADDHAATMRERWRQEPTLGRAPRGPGRRPGRLRSAPTGSAA